mmetsp:Transcript_10636/g.20177  ORF Transcript_10636/g.20177 Transcript_10636/m.20177 type:complete len:867 (-) Transcript_10636:66-2666(-)
MHLGVLHRVGKRAPKKAVQQRTCTGLTSSTKERGLSRKLKKRSNRGKRVKRRGEVSSSKGNKESSLNRSATRSSLRSRPGSKERQMAHSHSMPEIQHASVASPEQKGDDMISSGSVGGLNSNLFPQFASSRPTSSEAAHSPVAGEQVAFTDVLPAAPVLNDNPNSIENKMKRYQEQFSSYINAFMNFESDPALEEEIGGIRRQVGTRVRPMEPDLWGLSDSDGEPEEDNSVNQKAPDSSFSLKSKFTHVHHSLDVIQQESKEEKLKTERRKFGDLTSLDKEKLSKIVGERETLFSYHHRLWLQKRQKPVKIRMDQEAIDRYTQMFQLLDVDSTGYLSLEKVKEALSSIGIRVSQQELYRMAQAAGADANGLISIDRFVKQLVVSSEWDEILRIFQNRKQEMFGDQTSPTLDKKNKKRMVAIAKDQAFKRALGRMQEINMKQFEVFANEHIQELMGVGPEESRKILRAHSRRQSRDDRETLQNAGRAKKKIPEHLDVKEEEGVAPVLPFVMWVPAWKRWDRLREIIDKEHSRRQKRKAGLNGKQDNQLMNSRQYYTKIIQQKRIGPGADTPKSGEAVDPESLFNPELGLDPILVASNGAFESMSSIWHRAKTLSAQKLDEDKIVQDMKAELASMFSKPAEVDPEEPPKSNEDSNKSSFREKRNDSLAKIGDQSNAGPNASSLLDGNLHTIPLKAPPLPGSHTASAAARTTAEFGEVHPSQQASAYLSQPGTQALPVSASSEVVAAEPLANMLRPAAGGDRWGNTRGGVRGSLAAAPRSPQGSTAPGMHLGQLKPQPIQPLTNDELSNMFAKSEENSSGMLSSMLEIAKDQPKKPHTPKYPGQPYPTLRTTTATLTPLHHTSAAANFD